MDSALKQRLIGVLVLISVGLIVIPILFSNKIPADEVVRATIKLPSPPPLPAMTHALSIPETPAVRDIEDMVKIPDVWVVQLGVFKNIDNANKLIHELRSKGFPAFTKLSKLGAESTTRVFIGPEINQEKAKYVAAKLEQVFHIKGMVVRHKL